MKILNILLDGRIAGPQIRVCKISQVLASIYNIESMILFPDNDSAEYEDLVSKGKINYKKTRLHKLSNNLLRNFRWLVLFWPEVLRISRLIARENPDIVHCHTSWQWKGIVAAKLMRKPLVVHLNDTRSPFFIRMMFRSLFFPLADVVIHQGKRVQSYYLGELQSRKKIVEIPSSVDCREFDPAGVQAHEGISRYGGIRIITVGNVNPDKGLEYLVETAYLLGGMSEDLHFIVVGGLFQSQKRYIRKIRRKIEKRNLSNFILFGPTMNVPGVLKAADIYICSSIAEASPISVWEAMSMKKPVVSSDVGSINQYIKDGVNGFIVSPRSPVKLAEKIEFLVKNPDIREQYARKSWIIAREKLDTRIQVKKYLEVYNKLAGGR